MGWVAVVAASALFRAVQAGDGLGAPGGGNAQEPMAQKINERVEARYEAREVPFGKVYEWHPAYITIECDCGEKVTLSATSTTTTCGQCDADLGGLAHDLQEREAGFYADGWAGVTGWVLVKPWGVVPLRVPTRAFLRVTM
jgi:hypothetical protein